MNNNTANNCETTAINNLMASAKEVANVCGGEGKVVRIDRVLLNGTETWFYIPPESSIGKHNHPELEDYKVLLGELEINGQSLKAGQEISFAANKEHSVRNVSSLSGILYSRKKIEKE